MLLSLCIVFILLLSLPCAAQNESGKRFLSKGFEKRSIWYDSTLPTNTYYQKHPIIRRIPPLNSGMPYDVMAAYIYLDSLARFYDNPSMITGDPALIAQPEMLKKLAANNYIVVDYSPALFRQYDIETTLKSSTIFKWFVGRFTEPLPDAIAKAASNPREADALTSVMLPDYVLRVKVIAIDSVPLAKPTERAGTHVYNVTAKVLDTLKGRVFVSGIDQTNSAPERAAIHPYMSFQFYRSDYSQDNPERKFTEDSAFLTDNGTFAMHVGQEAIVFLKYFDMKYTYTHDYLELATDARSSYNALPIIDGKVRDVNRIWSDQLMIDYNDWRNRFMGLRDKILTGTY